MLCSEPSAVEAPRLPPLCILVVDDNAINKQVVGGLLAHAGHTAVTVDSGQAAVAAVGDLDAPPFDVVLMDVQMPGMDGLTATRMIRALPAPRNAVPMVALTAHASNSSRTACLAAGMNGFVSKPVRQQPLLAEIAAVVGPLTVRTAPGPQTVPSAEPAEVLVDTEQIAELTASLSPESWDMIIRSFAATADAEIEHIHAAIATGDSPACAAHTLKGLAWNTGAVRLGDLAHQLEAASPADARLIAEELGPVRQRTLARLTTCTLAQTEA
jgi:CheY-like chemotaxis protein/HPt (histidine-containing phosphotransfer) domain-containing protein